MAQTRNMEAGYVDNDRDLIQYMNSLYEENSSQWLQFQREADIDTRFAAGDQEGINQYVRGQFNYINKSSFGINKIRPMRNQIAGYQISRRKSSIVIPQEDSDQQGADDLSGVIMWTMKKMGAYKMISDSFRGCLTTGIDLMHAYVDYKDDPSSGDIMCTHLAYNEFMIDPFFRKADLTDCRYIWTRRYYSKPQLKMLFPGRDKEIDDLTTEYSRDGKFLYLPQNFNYRIGGQYPLDEFYYQTTEEVEVLLDQVTGETAKWYGSKEDLQFFVAYHPLAQQLEVIKRPQTVVKRALVVQNKVFYHSPKEEVMEMYPFRPMTCYFEPESPYIYTRIQGIVRNLRDLQWSYNRRQRLQLSYLEAGISRGVRFEEDAFVDPNDAYMQGMGKAQPIKKSQKTIAERVQDIPPPQIPPSWFQEMELLEKDMMNSLNLSETAMGFDDSDRAGIISMLRQSAGMTGLAPIMEQVDNSQIEFTKLVLNLIQNHFTPQKMERILNRPVDINVKNKFFTKYDVSVEEGMMTDSQRQMQAAQLMELMQMGIQIPPEQILKAVNIQDKGEVLQAVQQSQQQQSEMAMQQQQLEQAKLQAEINRENALAESDIGLAKERATRAASNMSLTEERRMEAIKDLEQAEFNKVKALKELEGMDVSQLSERVGILNALKESEEAEVQKLSPLNSSKV